MGPIIYHLFKCMIKIFIGGGVDGEGDSSEDA